MTLNSSTAAGLSDAELVDLSRDGDRDGFGLIVSRYQSLVCALAYSACGNFAQSEDIAQEVFLSAWKQIRGLREPDRLKEWLCGIARHTAIQAYRRSRREPAQLGGELNGEDVASEPQPSEHAARHDEELILWRALAQLPETYREALVLYYREHRSIEHVASALDLSEENVRQRLSRGRKALQEKVTRMLESTLAASAPGPAFQAAVLAALPPLAAFGGSMAAGSTAIKGGAAAKAGFAGLMGLTAWLSGLLLPWLGMFIQVREAQTPQERKKVISMWTMLWLGCAAFVAGLFVLSLGSKFYWSVHSHQRALVLITGIAVYTIVFGVFVWKCVAGRRQIRPQYEFRSRTSLLGSPLIHIRSASRENGRVAPAKGWIAMGPVAYGRIFACGALAVAPVSIGALSVGVLSFGCIGVGVFAVGSIALGTYALGGIAAGYLAWGGCALGWHAAMGGAVWARDYALGGGFATVAAHANGLIAKRAIGKMFFFRHSQALFTIGLIVSWAPLLISSWRRRYRLPM